MQIPTIANPSNALTLIAREIVSTRVQTASQTLTLKPGTIVAGGAIAGCFQIYGLPVEKDFFLAHADLLSYVEIRGTLDLFHAPIEVNEGIFEIAPPDAEKWVGAVSFSGDLVEVSSRGSLQIREVVPNRVIQTSSTGSLYGVVTTEAEISLPQDKPVIVKLGFSPKLL